MPTPRPTIAAMAATIRTLEEVSRSRPLNDGEAAQLDSLLLDQRRRLSRLPDQIAACEAKAARLRAEQALLS